MRKTVTIAVAVVLVAAVAGGAVWLARKDSNKTASTTSQSTSSSNASTSTGSSTNQTVAATIAYDGSNFTPEQTTVKSGDTVKITNQSQQEISFNSDPHPVHTDDTDLNVGTVAPGESKTFTVTKKGSFGFHNHLDPSQQGNITIQ